MIPYLALLLTFCQLSVTTSAPPTSPSKDIVITAVKDADWLKQVKATGADQPDTTVAYVEVPVSGRLADLEELVKPIQVYLKRSEIKKDTLEAVLRFIQNDLYWTYAVFKQRQGYNDVEIVVRSDGRWTRRTAGGWAPIDPMSPMIDKRLLPPSWGGSYDGRMPMGQGNSLNSWRERKDFAKTTYFWFARNKSSKPAARKEGSKPEGSSGSEGSTGKGAPN